MYSYFPQKKIKKKYHISSTIVQVCTCFPLIFTINVRLILFDKHFFFPSLIVSNIDPHKRHLLNKATCIVFKLSYSLSQYLYCIIPYA